MGILKETIDSYDLLCKNDYIYHLSDGRELKIIFKKENFPHLLGLHKLLDIEILRKHSQKIISANSVYRDLKRGLLTYTDVSNSVHFYEIENRFMYINELDSLLFDRIVLDFDKTKIATKITATILLYRKIDHKYVHLALVKAVDGSYVPQTLLVQGNRYYVDNQKELIITKLTIKNRGRVIEEFNY
ncbi:MAG: PBECR4 domain-containing protein [Turicibacter sp.]